MPANFENVENVMDRPPIHTKTAHVLLAEFGAVDFENGTLTGAFLKQHRVNTRKWCKQNISRRCWDETDRFLGCRYISLASKSCNEFL